MTSSTIRLTRAATTVAGAGILLWGLSASPFRNPEGSLSGSVCIPLAICLSLTILGFSVGRHWLRAAGWLVLLLIGQAAALQWIDAGISIHYQHYKSPAAILSEHWATAAFFLLQTLLVAAGIWRRRQPLGQWLKDNPRMWRFAAAIAVVYATGAAVSRDVSFFAVELVLAAAVQTVQLATIVLAAASVPEETVLGMTAFLNRFLGASGDAAEPVGLDRFAWTAALSVALLTAGLSIAVYERHPHLADEVSYLYQARYFAEGRITADPPPASEAFSVDLMTYEKDRWYSPFPPGWPIVLAAGVLAGAPWLVNPVLGGAGILLAYLLFRELLPRRSARLGVILLCASPWQLFMAMSFMSHTLTLACGLLAALGVARSRRTGSVAWTLAAGLAVGEISLIRPLDGVILAAALGLWSIGLGGKRLRTPAIAAFVIGVAGMGAVAFPYNRALTGSASLAPVMDYFNRYYGKGVNDLGFGPNRGVGWALDPYPGHTPVESAINANLNAYSINVELFGWPTGSLLLLGCVLCLGKPRRTDYLMFTVIVLTAAALSLYWFSGGPDFGARYWYVMLIPCVVLTVRGVCGIDRILGRHGPRATAAVLCMCAGALFIYVPWRAADKYHRYLNMQPGIREMAARGMFGKSLVLIRGKRHPDYASTAIYNSLDMRSDDTVYAWDKNPEARRQARQAFPGRPVWIVDGPSVTRAGYRVAAGPLEPASAILDRE